METHKVRSEKRDDQKSGSRLPVYFFERIVFKLSFRQL